MAPILVADVSNHIRAAGTSQTAPLQGFG
jgi:hypothetical protein